MTNHSVLNIKKLTISAQKNLSAPLVDDLNLEVNAGEIVGLVGESGSGKSLTCLATLKLLPSSLQVSGEVRFDNTNVYEMDANQLRNSRGKVASIIFQEPMSSLNPVLNIRQHLYESLRDVDKRDKKAKEARSLELLEMVGINDPARRLNQYPHEFSGGMCQRIMIAMAMAGNPKILIADEPTTALDVTIQAQILSLLNELTRKHGMALLLVSHDLGVIAQNCDRVVVMYAGRVIEDGPVADVFENPLHPYTKGLLSSLPSLDGVWRRLPSLRGTVPTIDSMPKGCRFNPRCDLASEVCFTSKPELLEITKKHYASCWELSK
jgi:peptide/nickel transport system ATP-binding protein